MIDRHARNELIAATEAFLNEEIWAFEYDERKSAIGYRTQDETVRYAADVLWYFYDDTKDHPADLSRPAWNYIQRILLLLHADAELVKGPARLVRHRGQIAAILALVVLAGDAAMLGWGPQLYVLLPLAAAVSMAIARIYREPPPPKFEAEIYPFATFGELWQVARATPSFRKAPFRRTMQARPVHGWLTYFAMALQWYFVWIVFSPCVLIWQSLPKRERRSWVKLLLSSDEQRLESGRA